MPTIENFATVSYTSGGVAATKNSNLAEIELDSSLGFSKATLGTTYSSGSPITYVLSVTNNSTATVTDLTVTDNLGTFTEGATELTPLTFLAPALLLINGQDSTALLTTDATSQSAVVFSFPSLAPGDTANIIYNAIPNSYAPLVQASTITNTATLQSNSDCADGEASATVTVSSAADIEVIKSMCPNPVVCGDTITYTVKIYNYGNIDAEDVVLTDTFNPAPTNISVSRNGVLLGADDYTYVNGTLTVPVAATEGDTVPAATFVRNPETGEVTVIPGLVEYVITGTI
ncbi:MAG: DUF11 domain-containing protein [Ruminococcaceae bacterium]|nr:DUF11 domain-containing protein [Oscillospiraceae bacterium]